MNRNFILNSLFLAAIVSVVTLQPYFMHGYINFYETGIYLPQINELWYGQVIYKDMFIMRGPLEILMPKGVFPLAEVPVPLTELLRIQLVQLIQALLSAHGMLRPTLLFLPCRLCRFQECSLQ